MLGGTHIHLVVVSKTTKYSFSDPKLTLLLKLDLIFSTTIYQAYQVP